MTTASGPRPRRSGRRPSEGRVLSIREPDTFTIVDETGLPSRGCDQDWFGSEWQRISGCGPSVASGILYYLHRTGRIRLPFDVGRQSECIALMETVWKHVTPTSSGVDSLERFCDGVRGFLRSIGHDAACRSLGIPKDRTRRPGIAELVRFLSAGLDRDCPVAFLNLSSGRVRRIEGWHWMTVVALRTGQAPDCADALIFDGATSTWIDIAKWLATSALGGGFAYLEADAPEDPARRPGEGTA